MQPAARPCRHHAGKPSGSRAGAPAFTCSATGTTTGRRHDPASGPSPGRPGCGALGPYGPRARDHRPGVPATGCAGAGGPSTAGRNGKRCLTPRGTWTSSHRATAGAVLRSGCGRCEDQVAPPRVGSVREGPARAVEDPAGGSVPREESIGPVLNLARAVYDSWPNPATRPCAIPPAPSPTGSAGSRSARRAPGAWRIWPLPARRAGHPAPGPCRIVTRRTHRRSRTGSGTACAPVATASAPC